LRRGERSQREGREYNEERPHSSLGYRTPAAFAREVAANGCGKDARCGGLENLTEDVRFSLSHSLGGGVSTLVEEKSKTQDVV